MNWFTVKKESSSNWMFLGSGEVCDVPVVVLIPVPGKSSELFTNSSIGGMNVVEYHLSIHQCQDVNAVSDI